MNKIILMGRLVRDPEIRSTSGGTAVAIITIACDRPLSRDKKAEAERNGKPTADFIRAKAFGTRAETIERYLEKGSRVLIDGRLELDSYTNQQGQRVNTTEVMIDNIQIIDFKNSENKPYKSLEETGDEFDDDEMELYSGSKIPF